MNKRIEPLIIKIPDNLIIPELAEIHDSYHKIKDALAAYKRTIEENPITFKKQQ